MTATRPSSTVDTRRTRQSAEPFYHSAAIMFIFSAALRTVRGAYSRTSTRLRHTDALAASPRRGGPFLHWVPDRPEGCRLAGEYVPVDLDPARQPAASRRPHRRR